MTPLPIVDLVSTGPPGPSARLADAWAVPLHVCRVAMFFGILFLVRQEHVEFLASQSNHQKLDQVSIAGWGESMPQASQLTPFDRNAHARQFLNSQGISVGCLVQTSPSSDSIVGYIGPTNLAVAVRDNGIIANVQIIQSADTTEHIEAIQSSDLFLDSFVGLDWNRPDSWPIIDSVSGATLSCYAIIQSVAARAGGEFIQLKFPQAISNEEISDLYGPHSMVGMAPANSVSRPVDAKLNNVNLGYVLRTSKYSQGLPGYQGPTDTLLALDTERKLKDLVIRSSFDNEPYVRYVKEDRYLKTLLNGKTLEEIAVFDSVNYEGVSGATMTSVNVLAGIKATAVAESERGLARQHRGMVFTQRPLNWQDLLTVILASLGVLMGLTRLRGNKAFRISYLVIVFIFLGFMTGNMLSAALVIGWAQNGLPVSVAPALILLVAAAFATPVLSKHNVYCRQICPFGTAQQLAKGRIGFQYRPGKRLSYFLKFIPCLLLFAILLAGFQVIDFNLASLEAFDAFTFQIAGWATLGVFITGLISSLFVPMAYCRFGCPTGATLDFIRFNAKSGKIVARDGVALCLVILALLI